MAILDAGIRRFFWRIVDGVDYWLTLTKLRVLDALAGTEVETMADEQRKRDREQIEKSFPNIKP